MKQKPEIEIGKPLTADDLLTFELPPITEKSGDFIGADPSVSDAPAPLEYTGEPDPGQAGDRLFAGPSTDAEAHRGQLSGSGEKYDPAIHAYPPKETGKTKNWRKKPRKQMEAEKQAQPDAPNVSAEIRRNAEDVALTYGEAHQLVYGEHGAVENQSDLMPLINALERKFEQDGMVEMPPTVAVIMNAAFYSLRVARREQNKEKTAAILSVVKSKVGGGFNWVAVKLGFKKARPKIVTTQEGETTKTFEPLTSSGG